MKLYYFEFELIFAYNLKEFLTFGNLTDFILTLFFIDSGAVR